MATDPSKLSSASRLLKDDLKVLIFKLQAKKTPRCFWLALAGESLVELMFKYEDRSNLYTAIGNWQREAYEELGRK